MSKVVKQVFITFKTKTERLFANFEINIQVKHMQYYKLKKLKY